MGVMSLECGNIRFAVMIFIFGGTGCAASNGSHGFYGLLYIIV